MTITPNRLGAEGLRSFLKSARKSVLARDVGSLWVAEAVVFVMALLQAAIVARALGPKEFGVAALVLSTTALVFTFLDPQSQEAVVKYLGMHHANGQSEKALAVPKVAYGSDLFVGVVGFAVLAAGAPWAADHVIRSPGVGHLLVSYAAASMLAGPSATSRAVLTTFGRFSTVALLQAGSAIFRTTLMIVLVMADLGVRGVVYAAGLSLVAESVCAAVLAERAVRGTLGGSWWRGRRSVLGDEFREIVRFMVYTDLTSLVTVFVKQADLVVLGYIRGPTEAGYYRVARLVAAPLSSIVAPLQQVIYPRLAAMAGTNDEQGMQHVAWRYTVKVGLPIAVTCLLAVPLLFVAVPAVAGSDYRPAVGAAVVIFVGGALMIPAFWVRPMLLAAGQVRFLLGLSLIAAALTLLGYFVLGEMMGNVGVAISRAGIAGVAGTLVAVAYFFRHRAAPRSLGGRVR